MQIAIVGAGFSGLSVAWHLLQLTECEITLFESKSVGGGASGIATGLIHPYVGEQARRSALATEGLAATHELILIAEKKLNEKIILQKGVLRYTQDEEQRQMFLSHCQTFDDVKQQTENRFWIESGMTIDCPRYLEGLSQALFDKGVKFVVKEIEQLSSLTGFNHIVVASGAGSKSFSELDTLRISTLKGQVLKCYAPASVQLPEVSSIGKGYVAVSSEQRTCFIGSTYQRGDQTAQTQPELAKEKLFPKIASFFPTVENLEIRDCRAAFRVTRFGHYLPIATRVKDNIWALTALGSRGLLYHAYFGKTLARAIVDSLG